MEFDELLEHLDDLADLAEQEGFGIAAESLRVQRLIFTSARHIFARRPTTAADYPFRHALPREPKKAGPNARVP